ncbi:MAG: sugar ABC transporter substrate-binding protein, partial [Bryobacteraceae bacterium]
MPDPAGGRRRSLPAAVAALAFFVLATSNCPPPPGKAAREIVLVTKALDSEWWQRVKAGAEEAARADPRFRFAVLTPEREINIHQQAAILEDQVVKRVAAVAVAPAGVPEIIPVLDKAWATGIPVLIVDTDIAWPPKLTFIGLDNRLGGRLAGDFI